MIIPLGHRVLVKPHKIEETDEVLKSARAVGIELIESNLKLEQISIDKGIVILIGPTAFKDFGTEPWCAVGDIVAYARHGGKSIIDPDTNENYLVLNDEDLIAKLTQKEASK